jgi:hypothetical protein
MLTGVFLGTYLLCTYREARRVRAKSTKQKRLVHKCTRAIISRSLHATDFTKLIFTPIISRKLPRASTSLWKCMHKTLLLGIQLSIARITYTQLPLYLTHSDSWLQWPQMNTQFWPCIPTVCTSALGLCKNELLVARVKYDFYACIFFWKKKQIAHRSVVLRFELLSEPIRREIFLDDFFSK